jgi:hypothetical protein
MKEYTVFYHDGGAMFAGDEDNWPRGWYVWANGEYHHAEMPLDVQEQFGESSW